MSSYSSPGTIANDLTGRSHLYEPRVSRSPVANTRSVPCRSRHAIREPPSEGLRPGVEHSFLDHLARFQLGR